MLSKADHERIAHAIAQAEQRTSGEIFCVLTGEVSRYREVPLAWAALVSLALPPLLVLVGIHPLAAAFNSAWIGDSAAAAERLIQGALLGYAVLQGVLFVAVALIVGEPRLRRLMTPRFLKRHRVRQVARHHFAAAGARRQDCEPHILIYASLHDRQVELVAHKAIHDAVGKGPWNAAVAAVTDGMRQAKPADGFLRAIAICGDALAAHFPSQGPRRHRSSDDLLET